MIDVGVVVVVVFGLGGVGVVGVFCGVFVGATNSRRRLLR